MIGLGAPWWLIALAAIPLLRWLHRWQAPLSAAPVSAAFLWNRAESLGTGGARRQTPDPAWRRRALIAGLLVIAMAQPWWQRDSGVITVWIDDSLSMSASESGVSRLATALDELREALPDALARRVTLRSLSDPARALLSSNAAAFDPIQWLVASRGEPDPPPVAMLSPDAAHWLVTDGANERLVEWALSAPLRRIIRVGTATENVAVTQLAARRSLDSEGAFDLLIGISNQGTEAATRELHLTSDTRDLATWALSIRAGETQTLTANHVIADDTLTAALNSGDAVALDDSLVLPPSAIARTPVSLDAACPADLSLAIRSHPGLDVVAAGVAAELQLDCSDRPRRAQALLRFHTSAAAPVDAPAEWTSGVGRLQELHLPEDWIAAATWDAALLREYEILLAVNDKPLLVRHQEQPFVIETVLDMSRPQFTRQPEYAVLIAGLIDLALGRAVLDATAIAMNDVEASNIVPSDIVAPETYEHPHGAIRQPVSDMLLALAAFLLFADMLLLWRAGREARRA